MASYKAGFDPPNRPGEVRSDKRAGTYWQPTLEKQIPRKADSTNMPGQLEPRRGNIIPQPTRSQQQSSIPRAGMRSPSPGTTRTLADPKPSVQRFGFGRSSGKPPAPTRAAPGPELKGKSSRNVLRRKPSMISQHPIPKSSVERSVERSGSTSPSKWLRPSADNRPSIDSSLKSAEAYSEIFTRGGAKTPLATESPQIYPELDRYRTRPEQFHDVGISDLPPKLSTSDLPPPTPLYSASSGSHHRYSGTYSASGYSASPSTRFSESPGPGAAYSRNTTPTSISSQSPGIFAPVKPITPRLRQGSPAQTRPPITRRRAGSNSNDAEGPIIDPHGLPSLRESSSSNSTVKAEAIKAEAKTPESKKKKKRLSPLPPSPPPRKSSQKFKKPGSDTPEESPTKVSSTPAKSVMTSPTQAPPVMKQMVPGKPPGKFAPARPSREGAPDLQPQFGESLAIIQSNLTGLTFPSGRRQSGIARASPLVSQLSPRSTPGSRLPSRNPSPNPIQPTPREATPAPAGLGIIPDLRPQAPAKNPVLRTPSPSVSTHKHRFGLFGRRNKTAPEAVPTEKAVRKGPAAGTGHEGYGRYAPRGRSTSAGGIVHGHSRNVSAASSSMDSVSSTRTHDPFLLERMSPVIISGGEVIENYNIVSDSRTESNTSLLLGRPSLDSRGSSKSSLGKEAPRGTLWPSALPKESSKRMSTLVVPKGRRPSDSSDDGIGNSSLAFRRSIQRTNDSGSAQYLPRPINVAAGSSVTSLAPSILSDESADMGRGRKNLIVKSKKLEKRPKSPKKWGIFHRSGSKAPEPKVEAPAVSVTVGRPLVKAVPHYAIMDNSSDDMPDYMDGVDLEELLADVEVVELSNEELDFLQFGELKANLKREKEQKEQKLKAAKAKEEKLPPIMFASPKPMDLTHEIPQTELHLTREEAPVRPSRLPQVGRIPKVVSARPQATSPKSFSRPFARLSVVQPLLEPIVIDKESVAAGPSPPKQKQSMTDLPRTNLQADIDAVLRQVSLDSTTAAAARTDFFAFSPRKGSEATSSSSGCISFTDITTAVIPEPDAVYAEDEIWDEYDDLIENNGSNKEKVPVSATSSHGVPFQYESYETRRIRRSAAAQAKETAAAKSNDHLAPADNEAIRSSILTASSVYSTELSPRMKESLAALPTPTTPSSFTDFISSYGDRNNSVQGDSAKKPVLRSRSNSRKSNTESTHTRSPSGLLPIKEQGPTVEAVSPTLQVNLRLGSMTVSKWLTFGHVLFSPARDSIKSDPSKRHSILVIDGLGNDDWSFYASELYPTATFYNLSPTAPLPTSLSSSPSSTPQTSFPHTPPNHRQVQHLSPTLKFPFPSSTFHVVVFRFPTALPISTYQTIISESKRVLLPGGYLEMAILDVDMMNMGPLARRSVRTLKMNLQQQEGGSSIWTGSASDTVLKIIGKRGFESVKSCAVGVPVAIAGDGKGEVQGKSLADLMREESTAKGDEGITGMVAKVGRWWYTRCYELPTSANSTNSETKQQTASIFNDQALIAEAEEWKSSFKLLVAHARKPIAGGIAMGGKRRTLSA